MIKIILPLIIIPLALSRAMAPDTFMDTSIANHEEKNYLRNIRHLTFEGSNGEGYFSRDMKKIIFQSIRGENPCYQIYAMDIDGSNKVLVSGGDGKTTCSYFRQDGKKIIYASAMP